MPARPTRARPAATPEQILADCPPEVRALAEHARRFVRRAVPTATEVAYPGWRGIGYRDPQSGYFCGVFPRRDHVRLLFEHGAALRDPDGLLEGDGRQVRYVTVRRVSDLRRPALRRLVEAALLYGAV